MRTQPGGERLPIRKRHCKMVELFSKQELTARRRCAMSL
ncbi:conserved hypothetical protein [Roseibium sp. TrichSKD4]|nr:conserved hypothetical protein [Roseibium sp. TrichSKD4]